MAIVTTGLQQTGGAHQTVTSAGMNAWIANVLGFRAANAGKKALFSADRDTLIRTSRRAVED